MSISCDGDDRQTDQNGERKRDPVRCKLYDARGSTARPGFSGAHVMSEVSYLRQKERLPPFSYLLADQEPVLKINSKFGNAPLGSCLSYQLTDFGRPKTKFIANFQANANKSVENLTFDAFPDIPRMDPFDIEKFIPNNDFHMSAKEYFSDNVIIDLTSATDLEKGTVLQGECSE